MGVYIGRQDSHLPLTCSEEQFAEQNGDGVRFFAGAAPRAPNPEMPPRAQPGGN